MKRLIFVVVLLLCLELVLTKSSDKVKQHRKKTTSVKKKTNLQKTSLKSLVNLDLFKTLPSDDLEFIKDLDKQFKLHGDKIKIKIERATSNSTKNSKRTIDGDLGYGYQNPQHRYQFSPPKYVVYPYSQRDIPPIPIHQQSNHPGSRTEVKIEPSHAFELKEIPNYPTYNKNHQLFVPAYHQPQNDDGYLPYQHHQQVIDTPQRVTVEPVIVLRIPGPTKYAAHLQALLQQYLELRAAHFIKILQESEAQQQHYQHEPIIHQQAEYPTQPEYQPQYEVSQNQDQTEYHHQHHQHHQQQTQYQPAEQVYEQVRQHQTEQAQSHQPQQEKFQIQYEHQQPQTEEQPAVQSQQQDEGHHYQHQPEQPTGPQQYVYESQSEQTPKYHDAPSVSYQYIQQPIFVPQQQHFMSHQLYAAPNHPVISTPTYLPPPPLSRKGLIKEDSHEHISENNPRYTHTKVIFTDGENNDNSNAYPLASITPAPRKFEPSPTERYNHQTLHYEDESLAQQQQQQQHQHQQQEQSDEYHNNDSEIMITQRPFNYHAHAVRQAAALKNKKRAATSITTDEQFRKLNKLIDRLKKNDE